MIYLKDILWSALFTENPESILHDSFYDNRYKFNTVLHQSKKSFNYNKKTCARFALSCFALTAQMEGISCQTPHPPTAAA